ncbi:GntR family transcriptional regulator [uncultured Cetobacterium sp.]|uniref:GntR family transcriptional regulator n=1 Tax=uncultured Cetobacterium sp. TaxID=527638 RepID=UPI0026257CDA|nr:GntR family transcriptional regulator [uncultured Cetobacterium sp.]
MRKNVSDSIYEALKNEILNGDLNFGDKIVETDYSKKLNVSRTPLREAIKKLEIEGIIERLPNGRLRVMEINIVKVEEIFRIRIALENILFEAISLNKEGLERLQQNLYLTKSYIQLKNWDIARELFVQYNEIFYEISNLEFTVKILKHYDFIISKLKRNSLQNPERVIRAYEEHQEIISLLKNGDLKKTKELNTKHLENAKEFLIDYLIK